MKEAFAHLDETMGGIDILVNNAGIVHSEPAYLEHVNQIQAKQIAEVMAGGPIETHWRTIELLTDEMFDRMLRIHLYGTFYCTREALPRLRAQGRGGRIINMGSIMGTASMLGAPDYCAAKGAILAFTRATAREAASYDVLVNAIAPGYIETELNADAMQGSLRDFLQARIPGKRPGRPDEVARLVGALIAEDIPFLTGETLYIDGAQAIAH